MAKTLGYMITWTTYGTWLQGDERGYVKDGNICPAFHGGFEVPVLPEGLGRGSVK